MTPGRSSVRNLCLLAFIAVVTAHSPAGATSEDHRPDLPSPICDGIQAPAESTVAVHVYAVGVQMYRWNGDSWTFAGPQATLFADSCHEERIGTHYGEDGSASHPAWEALDGSKVMGARPTRCFPDPGAIPWLGLETTSSTGLGILTGVTYIQRVATVGGTAPGSRGSSEGELARVPYTAEYYFYLPAGAQKGR